MLLQVWLVRFNEGICPIAANVQGDEDEESFRERKTHLVEEERRLAYVAVSRARRQLQV